MSSNTFMIIGFSTSTGPLGPQKDTRIRMKEKEHASNTLLFISLFLSSLFIVNSFRLALRYIYIQKRIVLCTEWLLFSSIIKVYTDIFLLRYTKHFLLAPFWFLCIKSKRTKMYNLCKENLGREGVSTATRPVTPLCVCYYGNRQVELHLIDIIPSKLGLSIIWSFTYLYIQAEMNEYEYYYLNL